MTDSLLQSQLGETCSAARDLGVTARGMERSCSILGSLLDDRSFLLGSSDRNLAGSKRLLRFNTTAMSKGGSLVSRSSTTKVGSDLSAMHTARLGLAGAADLASMPANSGDLSAESSTLLLDSPGSPVLACIPSAVAVSADLASTLGTEDSTSVADLAGTNLAGALAELAEVVSSTLERAEELASSGNLTRTLTDLLSMTSSVLASVLNSAAMTNRVAPDIFLSMAVVSSRFHVFISAAVVVVVVMDTTSTSVVLLVCQDITRSTAVMNNSSDLYHMLGRSCPLYSTFRGLQIHSI